jgi:hypothetical protein
MSGGSNARSLRLLIKAVQEHPNSLVLFGYTHTDRSEIYYPPGGIACDSSNFLQLGMQWGSWGEGKCGGMTINNFYIKNLYQYNNLKDLMFCVDSICSKHAVHFIHIPLTSEEIPEVDNVFTFENHKNYLDWCQARGFKKLRNGHYGQEVHNALAELIVRDLTL